MATLATSQAMLRSRLLAAGRPGRERRRGSISGAILSVQHPLERSEWVSGAVGNNDGPAQQFFDTLRAGLVARVKPLIVAFARDLPDFRQEFSQGLGRLFSSKTTLWPRAWRLQPPSMTRMRVASRVISPDQPEWACHRDHGASFIPGDSS